MDDSAADPEGLGLSPEAFRLPEAAEAPPSPAAFARRVHPPPPSVTDPIKRLEGMGFLHRQAEPGDLRELRPPPRSSSPPRDAGRRPIG